MNSAVTIEDFLQAARNFHAISDKINDGWKLHENSDDPHKSYLKKDVFFTLNDLVKAEYVIFYNMSYGVPSFSFNIWNSCGVLLALEDIRKLSFIKISQKDFYSVITQQEHPIFQRPYFIMHPCQTETVLAAFKDRSKNIIVTFLSLITPLIKLNLSLEYGV